jgi:hypothetical protein
VIAQAGDGTLEDALVLPRQAAEQDGGVGALGFGEVSFLRPFEVGVGFLVETGFALKPLAFLTQPLLDHLFEVGHRDEGRMAVALMFRLS